MTNIEVQKIIKGACAPPYSVMPIITVTLLKE